MLVCRRTFEPVCVVSGCNPSHLKHVKSTHQPVEPVPFRLHVIVSHNSHKTLPPAVDFQTQKARFSNGQLRRLALVPCRDHCTQLFAASQRGPSLTGDIQRQGPCHFQLCSTVR